MGSRIVGAAAVALGCAVGALAAHAASAGADIHAEYIKFASGKDSITGYIAYPETSDPAPAVIVIHEIFGMSDFVRDATQRIAKKGYVALAPDLLSRRGGTPASGSEDDARKLIASLNADTITMDLDAAAAYLKNLKAVDSTKLGAIGFCWGGGESFRYATNNPSLRAFVVCYGPGPNFADIRKIKASGFGVYADRDGRITANLYNLLKEMHKAKVEYAFTTYAGTSHGFLRTLQGKPKPNRAEEAWADIFTFFEQRLKVTRAPTPTLTPAPSY